jgi:Protein of unknown function (DUF2487)
MQWSANDLENWEELRQFVDTALLPLYLYRSELTVQEHVLRMNYLLNVAAGIEQKLKGRVLLYPMVYHFTNDAISQSVPDGFAHSVIVHFSGDKIRPAEGQGDILMLSVGEEELDSALRFEVTVDVLYKEVIKNWSK